MHQRLIDYSIGFFKHGGLSDALFNVHPLGGIKGALFVLNESFEKINEKNSIAVGSSITQTKVLLKYKSHIVSYPESPLYLGLRAYTIWIFFYIFFLTLYNMRKIENYKHKMRFIARFALFFQINTGVFIAKRFKKKASPKELFISTDHCPLVLGFVFEMKEYNPSVIVKYHPHGGNIGWRNAYRVFTWSLFDQIIASSAVQKEIFEYWLHKAGFRILVTIISDDFYEYFPAEKNIEISLRNAVVIWLNQADLWDSKIENFNTVTSQVLKKFASDELVINVVIKQGVPRDKVRQFFKGKEIRFHDSFSNYVQENTTEFFVNSVHIVLSSSVVLKILALGEIIFFNKSSPLYHDEGLIFAMEKRGFIIKQLDEDFWQIEPRKTVNELDFGVKKVKEHLRTKGY